MAYLSTNSSNLLKRKLSELRARGINPSSTLNEQFSVEFTYNFAALAGSSLTLAEAYKVATGIAVLATVAEVQKFLNIRKALELIISSALKDQILEQQLVDKVAELVCGQPVKLGKTLAWLRASERLEHPIDLAADFMLEALRESALAQEINLLLINHILLRARLPLTIVLYNDRKRYQRLMRLAAQGKKAGLAEFLNQSLLRSIETELEANDACSSKHLSLQELSEGTEYSEAYLRKLALAGKLEAYKIGRNWVSTREALENYSSSRRKTQKL